MLDVYYVCDSCDWDFHHDELAYEKRDGILVSVCPMCGSDKIKELQPDPEDQEDIEKWLESLEWEDEEM